MGKCDAVRRTIRRTLNDIILLAPLKIHTIIIIVSDEKIELQFLNVLRLTYFIVELF